MTSILGYRNSQAFKLLFGKYLALKQTFSCAEVAEIYIKLIQYYYCKSNKYNLKFSFSLTYHLIKK